MSYRCGVYIRVNLHALPGGSGRFPFSGLRLRKHARRACAHFGFRSSALDGTASVGFDARTVLLPHDGTRHARVLLQGRR
jgi:hypothetical protein